VGEKYGLCFNAYGFDAWQWKQCMEYGWKVSFLIWAYSLSLQFPDTKSNVEACCCLQRVWKACNDEYFMNVQEFFCDPCS
jgi:hypothetical protein